MTAPLYSWIAAPLPNGDTTIPVTAVVGYTNLLSCLLTAVALDALTWANPATQVVVALEVSYDGGATWLAGGSSSHAGSPGSQIAALKQFGGMYSYSAPPSHFRGKVTVSNGPLMLSGEISVS